MKELRLGDEVWVKCVVAGIAVGDDRGMIGVAHGPVAFRALSVDCRPAEPSGHLVMEAEIKVEDTPPTTTSKDYYGPDISKVTFQFTQTPNTLGTTDPSGVGSEELTVECEYQLPGEEPFFVIRSDSGWSFDDPESFLKLLLSVKEAEEKCRCSLPQS